MYTSLACWQTEKLFKRNSRLYRDLGHTPIMKTAKMRARLAFINLTNDPYQHLGELLDYDPRVIDRSRRLENTRT